jgi:hypothetical protein
VFNLILSTLGGGNRSTRKKPTTFGRELRFFSHESIAKIEPTISVLRRERRLRLGTARLCYQISKKLLKICQKVAPKFRKVAQKVAQSEKGCSKVALMFLYLQYTFDIISNSISNSNIKEHMYCSSFYIITRFTPSIHPNNN